MDTWSDETKQSQTKPILTDLPRPAQQKTSLTFLLTKTYTTTPQSQKRIQTNPISLLQPPQTPADHQQTEPNEQEMSEYERPGKTVSPKDKNGLCRQTIMWYNTPTNTLHLSHSLETL